MVVYSLTVCPAPLYSTVFALVLGTMVPVVIAVPVNLVVEPAPGTKLEAPLPPVVLLEKVMVPVLLLVTVKPLLIVVDPPNVMLAPPRN